MSILNATPPSSATVPRKTESEELVHALRNDLFALQLGVKALADARTDEPEFKAIHAAVSDKIASLERLLSKTVRLLEADRGTTRAGERIRVLCVDDSPDITAVLRMVIDSEPTMECVGCLTSADDLVQEICRVNHRPHVVLLDATMPGKSPLAAMRQLAAECPEVKTIIFSGHDDQAFIDRAFDAGAWGCVCKSEDPVVMLRAVREVAAGRVMLPER